jgi:hypothetical protein
MLINYRRLAVLLKWFPTTFYTISIDDYGIQLQGKYNPNSVKIIRAYRFGDASYDDNGYIVFNRGNIKITLTD